MAAALCAALTAAGERVVAFKPVVTGTDDEPGDWPPDHELLAGATGQSPTEVAPYLFGPAVSPHLAAELAGEQIEPTRLRPPAGDGLLVAEGVGGLMVPLTTGYLVRDLAVDLGLPLVIASRPGLGTISHTLLTIEAARAAGLTVAAVVMTPWPAQPSVMQISNRATVERLGGAPVLTLAETTPSSLAVAGAHLPAELGLTQTTGLSDLGYGVSRRLSNE